MKSFRINDKMQIIAKHENTRTGFRHRVTLMVNGRDMDETTVPYQNRTWESYEFESAINKLINKTSEIKPEQKQRIKDKLAGKTHKEIDNQFKTIGMVAKLGDIMTSNRKESNTWKKRMLKAGMGSGLDFPEDFDKLSESTKSARLNKVIGLMGEKRTKKKKKSSVQTKAEKDFKKLVGM